MAGAHVLFTGSVTLALRQLTCSQSLLDQFKQPGLNVPVIHGKQNSVSEPRIDLGVRSRSGASWTM